MHIPDGYLEPEVLVPLTVITVGAVAYSVARSGRELDERKVPLMGVMGAFVFAAQMINVPTGVGVSGHLLGGLLLSILLGAHPALVVVASIFIVQALIYADGGITALGANVFNCGVIPCFIGYSVYLAMKSLSANRRWENLATFVMAWFSVVLGSVCAAVELTLSGKISLRAGLGVIVMFHVVIGFIEGIVTVAAINFIRAVRPQVLTRGSGEQSVEQT